MAYSKEVVESRKRSRAILMKIIEAALMEAQQIVDFKDHPNGGLSVDVVSGEHRYDTIRIKVS